MNNVKNTLLLPISITQCEHNFVVQVLSGCYISVCTKCGTIGDTKQCVWYGGIR